VSDNDDHDRVMRIIMARCGDALTDADLATLTQHAGATAEPYLPGEIGEQILGHCQTKFYTACLGVGTRVSSTGFCQGIATALGEVRG
jgi:hypothetical protein